MPFSGFIDPDKLNLLTTMLDEYCAANNISEEQERRKAGELILPHFKRGTQTPAGLREALQLNTVASDLSELRAAQR